MRQHPQTTHLRSPSGCLSGAGLLCLAILAVGGGGCGTGSHFSSASPILDRVGRTYYLDGAGNWGFGVTEVREGLRRAGYRGNVVNYLWSPTFNPALDQTIGRVIARAHGRKLAEEISVYLRRYPDNQVNIIALSAGTGVGVWACEHLTPPAKVNTLILLGSSLSAGYDMDKALGNISRGVWVYYSPNDPVLSGPVRALGTIDGHMIADSAGLVGLHPPRGDGGKIHNIGWSEHWARFGWRGSHTDATSEPFVRQVLAQHILPPSLEDSSLETGVDPVPQVSIQKDQPTSRPAVQAAVHGQ